jgi:hypothetical protein
MEDFIMRTMTFEEESHQHMARSLLEMDGVHLARKPVDNTHDMDEIVWSIKEHLNRPTMTDYRGRELMKVFRTAFPEYSSPWITKYTTDMKKCRQTVAVLYIKKNVTMLRRQLKVQEEVYKKAVKALKSKDAPEVDEPLPST